MYEELFPDSENILSDDCKEEAVNILVEFAKIAETTGELSKLIIALLKRVLNNNEIHYEFVQNHMYKTAYIEGIGYIYEFDCGDMSGWLYYVNGKSPSVGCSLYYLKSGDEILFYYICR